MRTQIPIDTASSRNDETRAIRMKATICTRHPSDIFSVRLPQFPLSETQATAL